MTPIVSDKDQDSKRGFPGDGPQSALGRVRRIDSQSLLGSASEVLIAHDGNDYRLRLTRQGKLILTK